MPEAEVNIFTEDTARRFWEEQRQRVTNAKTGETIDFSDMEFPEDPADKYFREVAFSEIADFTGSIFQTGNVFGKAIFHRDAIFNTAIFKAKSDFPNVTFEDTVSFDEAIFSEAVGFHSNFQDKVSFEGAIFQSDGLFGHPIDTYFKDFPRLKFGSSLSFENAEFKSVVSFDNLDFDGNVSFKRTKFYYWSEFSDLKFNGEIDFEVSCFEKYAGTEDIRRNLVRFNKVIFNEKVSFLACSFNCKAIFQKILFRGESNFRLVEFREHADFVEIKTDGRMFFGRNYTFTFPNYPEDAIIPYRLAKLSADSAGDLRWAGRYHYQEQCAINKSERYFNWEYFKKYPFHSVWQYVWAWGEWLIGRGLFGYGEKPLRPLGAGAIVIVLCAAVFCLAHGIRGVDNPCSFGNALYFSIVTFTTLGYGDITAIPGMRWLSASEAILGAALMSLFIVALARKFSR